MTTEQQTDGVAILDLDPTKWTTFEKLWTDFIHQHPEFGYSDSVSAISRHANAMFPVLSRRGAMVRTRNGRFLAHVEKFPEAAFAYMIEPVDLTA
jgi:hypothetical protein